MAGGSDQQASNVSGASPTPRAYRHHVKFMPYILCHRFSKEQARRTVPLRVCRIGWLGWWVAEPKAATKRRRQCQTPVRSKKVVSRTSNGAFEERARNLISQYSNIYSHHTDWFCAPKNMPSSPLSTTHRDQPPVTARTEERARKLPRACQRG